MSAHLVRAAKVRSGDYVLDLACGPGNTAIIACKKGAKVVGIDITPELLVHAEEEASLADAKGIEWKEGDAESLPFEDHSFNVVLSSVGHMFALHPEAVAMELLRVVKPGGCIAFATWPPEHAVGRIFLAVAEYLPQTPDAPPSSVLWGIPEVIKKRLGSKIERIHFEREALGVPLLSANHYWLHMSTHYGPIIRALQSQDTRKAENLRKDFITAIEPFIYENILRLDYLLTVAIRA